MSINIKSATKKIQDSPFAVYDYRFDHRLYSCSTFFYFLYNKMLMFEPILNSSLLPEMVLKRQSKPNTRPALPFTKQLKNIF